LTGKIPIGNLCGADTEGQKIHRQATHGNTNGQNMHWLRMASNYDVPLLICAYEWIYNAYQYLQMFINDYLTYNVYSFLLMLPASINQ
jgi:hypothetical protein